MSEGVNNNRGHSDSPGGNDQAGDGVTTADDASRAAAQRTRAHARDGSGAIERTVSAILRVMERAERVETMMAEGMTPSAITLQLMRGSEECRPLTKAQAHRYQRAVRMRWDGIGRMETSEQRIQRYRQIAEHGIAQAARSKRKEYVGKDDDGKPMYEDVEHYDAKAVASLLAVLVKLEGDTPAPQLPPGTMPTVDGAVQVVDRSDLNETLRARLAAETKGGAGS